MFEQVDIEEKRLGENFRPKGLFGQRYRERKNCRAMWEMVSSLFWVW